MSYSLVHHFFRKSKLGWEFNGCQWLLMLVPLKGGLGGIFHPPEGKDYKWYILPIGGLYATYHLLGEPETTIE